MCSNDSNDCRPSLVTEHACGLANVIRADSSPRDRSWIFFMENSHWQSIDNQILLTILLKAFRSRFLTADAYASLSVQSSAYDTTSVLFRGNGAVESFVHGVVLQQVLHVVKIHKRIIDRNHCNLTQTNQIPNPSKLM